MSATPWSGRVLSLDDWDAIPEDDSHRYELVEGAVELTPSAGTGHQKAVPQLWAQLMDQLPTEYDVLIDMDVVLRGAPLPTIRKPDLIVVPSSISDTHPTRFRAQDVLVAVEIISPGSKRTDNVAKFIEYAEAGIESYWLVDIDAPVSMCVYRLIEDHYELDAESADKIEAFAPVPVTLDIRRLVRSRLSG